MKNVLALGINLSQLWDRFRDPQACKPFPGAGFLPHLAKLADEKGWEICSAKTCLERGHSNPKKVHVLQEEMNAEAYQLISYGCVPKVLFCMESKMYAPFFYDYLPDLKRVFKHQILFDGGTHQMYFPCFDEQDLSVKRSDPKDRKEICMISSNKQFWSFGTVALASPSFQEAVRNELHTARLRAIEENPSLDLYGRGWGDLTNIPSHFEHLKPIIQKAWKGEIDDKMQVLSQYKKAICYENVSLPGYVTEKVIDCLVAGTRPIYMGPKDFGDPTKAPVSKHSHESFASLVMELMGS